MSEIISGEFEPSCSTHLAARNIPSITLNTCAYHILKETENVPPLPPTRTTTPTTTKKHHQKNRYGFIGARQEPAQEWLQRTKGERERESQALLPVVRFSPVSIQHSYVVPFRAESHSVNVPSADSLYDCRLLISQFVSVVCFFWPVSSRRPKRGCDRVRPQSYIHETM